MQRYSVSVSDRYKKLANTALGVMNNSYNCMIMNDCSSIATSFLPIQMNSLVKQFLLKSLLYDLYKLLI